MNSGTLFSHPFLQGFAISHKNITLSDNSLKEIDNAVTAYEHASPADIRQALINRNEIMSSYAISQAEKTSGITPKQADLIRNRLNEEPSLSFNVDTSKGAQSIDKSFDEQEFLNILRTFRWASNKGISRKELSVDLILEVHRMLTVRLDNFIGAFFDVSPAEVAVSKAQAGKFHRYFPGKLRKSDGIVVGNYHPVAYREIKAALKDSIAFYQNEPTLSNLNIFTAMLYAVHPFSNGNKRVCRILEHALIRDLGFNGSNIYGHSYYYYKELARFYEHLSRSLETKNIVPTVNFAREAIFYSMLYVYQAGIKKKRQDFIPALQKRYGDKAMVLMPLVGNKESGFSELRNINYGQMTERTLINHLNLFNKQKLLLKRKSGREMFYSLALNVQEEEKVKEYINRLGKELTYMPEEMVNFIYPKDAFPMIAPYLAATFTIPRPE